MGELHVGVDVGTSSIKFLVLDGRSRILYESSVRYEYEHPHAGWSEIDPCAWVEIVLDGLAGICARFNGDEIRGIGVTGQMHTTVFVDAEGTPVFPAISWTDRRTRDIIPELAARLALDPGTARNSEIVATGCMLANLCWLKRYRASIFASLGGVMTPKDFIVLALTGVVSTDFSDASTSSLYDWEGGGWSEVAQCEFGLPNTIFPPIHCAASRVGFVTSSVMRRIGCSGHVSVVAGTGDNVASTLACDGFANDDPILSLGTSGVVIVPNARGQLKEVGKNVRACIRPGDPSAICQGSVSTGGRSLNWWLEEILRTSDYAAAESEIHADRLGADRVLFVPHMNGEKTVYREPSLRGAFYGFGLDTTRADMVQAVQEGVGFGLRALYECIRNVEDPDSFTVVGGGARNRIWVKMLAGIFNRPMKVYEESHEAVRGAAMLSLIYCGSPLVYENQRCVVVNPDGDAADRYESLFHDFERLGGLLVRYVRGKVEE